MHTVSPSANINRFPGIYSYCMRVFKASLAFLPAPEVKFGAWVLRDVKSHPVRTITCPCLLPSFLFLCCPAKAVRAKMKHSAVLNIPSMTVLMTETHNPKLCVSCAPLGPWSCVRAHGAGRFPGGNPWEDVPSLESRECERGIWGCCTHAKARLQGNCSDWLASESNITCHFCPSREIGPRAELLAWISYTWAAIWLYSGIFPF